jgi:hypothetical protein
VKRHLVAVVGLVDGLHDVDLAVVGPVAVVRQPEGGPRAAAKGRVPDVEDEEAIVVGALGSDADGEAPRGSVRLVLRANAGVDSENCRFG